MIIADTGFWVALFNPRDMHHQKVRTFAPAINEPLITTLPVVTEVCYLLQRRCNPLKAAAFLNEQHTDLFNLFAIEEVLNKLYELATQLLDVLSGIKVFIKPYCRLND